MRSMGPHGAALVKALPARAALPTDQVAVSRAQGVQAEVAVAVDPSDPKVLVGGSGTFEPAMRVYASTDGGGTWTSDSLAAPADLCGYGDPASRRRRGRPAVLRIPRRLLLERGADAGVARVPARGGPAEEWSTRLLKIEGSAAFNDKEAIAVDTSPASPHRGRLYLAWSRLWVPTSAFEVVVSHSDDDGATWSPAARVSSSGGSSQTFSSLALGADGTLYVAWLTLDRYVKLDRSTDGGDHFGTDVAGRVPAAAPVRALPRRRDARRRAGEALHRPGAARDRRFGSRPRLRHLRRRWHVRREQNVYVSAYDAATFGPLLVRRRVNPPDGAVLSDQFLPASALDASTGALWVCWYDTPATGRASASATRARPRTTAARPGRRPTCGERHSRTRRAGSGRRFNRRLRRPRRRRGARAPDLDGLRDLAALGEEIYTTVLELP